MNKKTKKADLILLCVIIGIGAILGLVLLLTRSAGASVQIRVDGKVVQTFPLSVDRSYTINGAEGGINELVIENNSARLIGADCPDALCVNMGTIRYNGESIICLPHKAVIEVIGGQAPEADDDTPDIIAGGRQG